MNTCKILQVLARVDGRWPETMEGEAQRRSRDLCAGLDTRGGISISCQFDPYDPSLLNDMNLHWESGPHFYR
ncbi:hypothetical protein SAMN05216420_104106 [Nitrosospira sp. Nl5]|uniref:hypothetical protein n=1 Tax=Nitrosospira sp. Nl5 TaxID=200120 RepID=UPI0008897DBE|nr:hypothetical protein [Nitrosospira sp. Nl5]SCY28486.1 hypothetical protein SAMN05216420_104106 [Nitrosospira sp. Nl5]